ncbi:MAG: RNA polymerase sigma factor [Myxococcota bacterium]
MDPELELLRAWREGDGRAGSRLFELHFDSVHRFFYGKIEDAQVDELTQETFLAVVRHRDQLSLHRSVRAYLFAVARHKLYDALRKQGRASPDESVAERTLEDIGPTPTSLLAKQQQHRLLLHALRGLPIDLQILMELRHFEDLRGPELAEALDVPEGTVRSRLRRSHRLLRERLEALAASPEEVRSTLSDLEDWAKVVRERFGEP